MEELYTTAMELISYSGNARSLAMEALQACRDGNIDQARDLLKECEESLLEAHKVQTSLLVKEAQGEKIDVFLLMVHAQDHLMNAITVKDLTSEIIYLHEVNKGEK